MSKPWQTENDYQAAGMKSAQKIKDMHRDMEQGADFMETYSQITEEDRHNVGYLRGSVGAGGVAGGSTFSAGDVFCPEPSAPRIPDTAAQGDAEKE